MPFERGAVFSMRKSLHLNLGVCLSSVTFLLGLAMFIGSRRMNYWSGYGPGESFMSTWVSAFLVMFSILSFFSEAKKEGIALNQIFPKGAGLKNMTVTWAALLVFLALVTITGFLPAAAIMLFLLFSLGYRWKHAAILSVIVASLCYVVFKILLQVPLPVGIFGI